MKRLIVAAVAVHVTLAAVSGHRAWVQVRRLDVRADGRVLHAGSTVRADVVSSGRATVDVRLELVQGARVEPLGARVVATGRSPAADPRPRRASLAVALAPGALARLRAGPALLRATATGRPQWLRTPPPTVRELPVEIARGPDAPGVDTPPGGRP